MIAKIELNRKKQQIQRAEENLRDYISFAEELMHAGKGIEKIKKEVSFFKQLTKAQMTDAKSIDHTVKYTPSYSAHRFCSLQAFPKAFCIGVG